MIGLFPTVNGIFLLTYCIVFWLQIHFCIPTKIIFYCTSRSCV